MVYTSLLGGVPHFAFPPRVLQESEFFELLQLYFPKLYDIKYLVSSQDGFHGGLNKLADDLKVCPRFIFGQSPLCSLFFSFLSAESHDRKIHVQQCTRVLFAAVLSNLRTARSSALLSGVRAGVGSALRSSMLPSDETPALTQKARFA